MTLTRPPEPAAPGFSAARRVRAFTLLELLTTMAIIAILAVLLLPAIQSGYRKARRIACTSQLKQIGTAFHTWAHDHNDAYPMQVSTNAGGTREYAELTRLNPGLSFAFRHFQTLSNDLVLTKVLLCPAEKQRRPARDFASLLNENVSYWLNNGAAFGRPDSPLAGDRNVRTAGRTEWAYLQFGPEEAVEFSADLHGYRGNVLFGDAHVDDLDSRALRLAFSGGTNSTEVTLALPARELPPEMETALAPAGDVGGNPGAVPAAAGASSARENSGQSAAGTTGGSMGTSGRAGAGQIVGGRPEVVVFTRLDGTMATSTVARVYTNAATAAARALAAETVESPPRVELAQSLARKAERGSHWLWLLLLLMVALSLIDKIRRRLRGRKRGAL